jgi:hypothetical protein
MRGAPRGCWGESGGACLAGSSLFVDMYLPYSTVATGPELAGPPLSVARQHSARPKHPVYHVREVCITTYTHTTINTVIHTYLGVMASAGQTLSRRAVWQADRAPLSSCVRRFHRMKTLLFLSGRQPQTAAAPPQQLLFSPIEPALGGKTRCSPLLLSPAMSDDWV